MGRVGSGRVGCTLAPLAALAAGACSHEPAPEAVVVPAQPPQTAPTTAPSPPPSAPVAPVAPVATEEPVTEAPPPAPPSEDAAYILARDPRAKGTPRQVALVETEVRGLESLNAQSPSAPVARRIMDGYAEIARLHTGAAASQARSREILQADNILVTYPQYAALDEVRYYRALAYDQNGDLKNARSGYYELIKNSPQSKLVPHAYFAFGEMFFFEAQHGDPSKLALARQAYQEVLKYPPLTNSVHAYAKKRMAQIPGGGAPAPAASYRTFP